MARQFRQQGEPVKTVLFSFSLLAIVFSTSTVACDSGVPPQDPSSKGGPAGAATGASSAPASNEEHVTNVEVPADTRAAVEAADRDADDKKLDAGRKPAELVAFAGIKPGMKVAELGAGGGYTTEILARAVGTTGTVYGHNTPWILEKFADKAWSARLAKPANKNVVKVTREWDDPFPPEVKDLDAVVLVLLYHDTFWMKADRDKMNASVFRALKPGGAYVIVDHAGRAGTGTTEVQSLHRIEEAVVRKEVPRAGFKLAAEASFLRNPGDTRDWNAAPGPAGEKRGTSDRFVLKYVKP